MTSRFYLGESTPDKFMPFKTTVATSMRTERVPGESVSNEYFIGLHQLRLYEAPDSLIFFPQIASYTNSCTSYKSP